ncbi:MAG: glycosyltransferase [Verrucomicrobia bacterium]|jgi:SAM-dependent methyltransferase|nr:glycosyltransferase [Verrucomicrobiota bacterium]
MFCGVFEKNLKIHFDQIAEHGEVYRARQRGFRSQLQGYYQAHVEPGLRVLELGCGPGDLLASLRPSHGLGVDLSPKMLDAARELHAAENLEFREGDLHTLDLDETFDVIILDYLIGYLQDVHECVANLRRLCHARTRVYIVSLNHAWVPLLKMARWVGLTNPQPESNWLSRQDIRNILELSDFEVLTCSCEQIFPFRIPLLDGFCNRYLVRLPGFRNFGMSDAVVARPVMPPKIGSALSCSVVVPARNESGNIRAALERIPTLGKQTEVIFVEGNSADDTWEVIQREAASYEGPHKVRYLQQPGKGKWDAVFAGFAVAEGDVLVIQDGDLTAPPEDLPKFYEAIATGRCEFANGCRLVYPMEKQAMRFLNLLGNKFFAAALSFVLGQPIKDSLCGTKMLLRSDYERLLQRIEVLGDFDPFGDFNLLFGSAMLDLKIRDILVRYRDRSYGDTNISRFRHGWILLKMTWFGLRKIKFFPLKKRY